MPARKFSNNVLWCLLQSAIDDIISFVNLNIRSTFFTGTHEASQTHFLGPPCFG